MERFSKDSGKVLSDIEPAFIQRLMENQWKGNIRQLENTIEHAVLVAQSGRLTIRDLPQDFLKTQEHEAKENLDQAREDRVESSRTLYREAILSTGGDVTQAAIKLGMSRATIYRRLKKYGLTSLISQVKRGS
jgi:two-component system response regulator HydG